MQCIIGDLLMNAPHSPNSLHLRDENLWPRKGKTAESRRLHRIDGTTRKPQDWIAKHCIAMIQAIFFKAGYCREYAYAAHPLRHYDK